jgi:hypothetical protein
MSYVYTENSLPITTKRSELPQHATQLTVPTILGHQSCFDTLFDLIDDYTSERNECPKNRAFYAFAYDLFDMSEPAYKAVRDAKSVTDLHEKRIALAKQESALIDAYFKGFVKQKTRTCKSCKNSIPLHLTTFSRLHRGESTGLIHCPSCRNPFGLVSKTVEGKVLRLRERYKAIQERYVDAYRKTCEKLYKKGVVKKCILIGEWVHEMDYQDDEDY